MFSACGSRGESFADMESEGEEASDDEAELEVAEASDGEAVVEKMGLPPNGKNEKPIKAVRQTAIFQNGFWKGLKTTRGNDTQR